MLTRRTLMQLVGAAPLALARDLRADVAILGAGVGGVAGALAALRNGMRVILTEETDWVGGQLTSQLVPPDEHAWVEGFGCTQAYRTYRELVRKFYRDHYPLTPEARAKTNLNPGDGTVSRITHEAPVSLHVLEGLLAPWLSSGQLTLLLEHKPVRADVTGDQIRAVSVKSLRTGRELTVTAPYFIDSTEMGDLLPLSRTEYVTGAESRKSTGEPHAPEQAQPHNHQAFTMCFAIDYREGEEHIIEKPAEYSFWRDYTPVMKPAWTGKLLSWVGTHPIELAPREFKFDPTERSRSAGQANLWLYRRIANKDNFAAPYNDISLINWPQNDYLLGNLHEVSEAEAAAHIARARQLSLSLLYWMQTECPRKDGKQGWPGLRLRYDLAGTEDGLAKYPYIRESRRIQAEFTVLEQHVGTDARMKFTGATRENVRAEQFDDSVGVGSYRIDLHPSSGGDNYIDVSSLPFQIPMGALIPRRMENLLAGCKNLGVTHITNGCYRLHPVEWNIGESAGVIAAEAVKSGHPPRKLRNDKALREALQAKMITQGIELAWPRLTPR